jgi:helix-turn-helix protein
MEPEAGVQLIEPIYTVKEASKQTRLSAWTLWDQLRKGKLLRTKVGGRTFIRESELRKLFSETRNDPPPPKAKTEKQSPKNRKTRQPHKVGA